MKYENELAELQSQQKALTEQIEFARTRAEREQVLELRAEIKRDSERLKELRQKSDEVAERNKPKIAELEAAIETMRFEVFDVWIVAEELERSIRTKTTEAMRLDRVIQRAK